MTAMTLRALAPAKVNLSLFLGGTREDGRHRLVTVFESLSLADTLELEVTGSEDVVVCPGVEGENLASRALAGLRARGWDGPPVRVTIEKRIPVPGGRRRSISSRPSSVPTCRASCCRDSRWGRAPVRSSSTSRRCPSTPS